MFRPASACSKLHGVDALPALLLHCKMPARDPSCLLSVQCFQNVQDLWGKVMWVWDRPHMQKLRLTISMANFRWAEMLFCRLGRATYGVLGGARFISYHARALPDLRPTPWPSCLPTRSCPPPRSIRLPALVALVATQIGLLSTSLSLPMLAPLLLGTGMLLRSIRTNASLIFPRIGLLVVLLWLLWFANSVIQNTVVYLRKQVRAPRRGRHTDLYRGRYSDLRGSSADWPASRAIRSGVGLGKACSTALNCTLSSA